MKNNVFSSEVYIIFGVLLGIFLASIPGIYVIENIDSINHKFGSVICSVVHNATYVGYDAPSYINPNVRVHCSNDNDIVNWDGVSVDVPRSSK